MTRPTLPPLRTSLLLILAGLGSACSSGGDDPPNFQELLFASDETSLSTYFVAGETATRVSTATLPGIPGTYDRTGTTITVQIENHNLGNNAAWVDLDFEGGTGGSATDGLYFAMQVDQNTFTVEDVATGDITGGTVTWSPVVTLPGTYSQTGTTVTITLAGHGLQSGDSVSLRYVTGDAVDDNPTISTVVDSDTFEVQADAAATASGDVDVSIGTNYVIQGMSMHPSGRWIYATSTFDCYNGDPYCWGSDLITRFGIDWSTGLLTFEESIRTADATIQNAAPVKLAFSSDGTQMFHQDDDLDGLWMWTVDTTTGELTQVVNSGSGTTDQHAVLVSEDGTRVYHGSEVFTVGVGSLTLVGGGSGGEANRFSGDEMFSLIGMDLEVFDLTDPDAPLLIATSGMTPNRARDFALFNDGALIVTAGFGGLKSYTYDGMAIAPAVGAGNTELSDGGLAFPTGSDPVKRIYRSVSRNAEGTLVAAAYFTNDQDNGNGGGPDSGFLLAGVEADGSLELLVDYPAGTYARAARFYQRP